MTTENTSNSNSSNNNSSNSVSNNDSNSGNSDSNHDVVLELDKVSYSYTPGGKKVLKDVSYKFERGRVYAITGPSGAGKTTLLSLLSGLTTPSEGRVVYKGKDLAHENRYTFRSHDIGVIFQSFNLLPALTVGENIILSMDASGKKFERDKKDIARELVEKVRLAPEYVNERILHLSGGEQQRVAIARALSYNPDIIVADEPTGNLDMATQDDIMNIFTDLAHLEEKCVIIVTHSPEVAQSSDQVFQLAALRKKRPTQRRLDSHGRPIQARPIRREPAANRQHSSAA